MKKIEKSSKIIRLAQMFAKNKIDTEDSLTFKQLTTVGCGGKIALAVFPNSVKQLVKVVKLLQRFKQKFVILGNGSNVLASDADFCGVVVLTRNVKSIKRKKHFVNADCGVHTVVLANFLAQNNLTGGEFLYCLPATVGGAVVMNAGCFGSEMKYIVDSITVLDKNGKIKKLKNSDCNFGYRSSILQQCGSVVLSVKLKFGFGSGNEILSQMKQLLNKKMSSQPLKAKSMGCVFFNEQRTASKLIDQAGNKGKRVGGAVVSQKHAGFILNDDNATSDDMLSLINDVAKSVEQMFSQSLQREIKLVGFDVKDKNDSSTDNF